jgi:hypothetical protein
VKFHCVACSIFTVSCGLNSGRVGIINKCAIFGCDSEDKAASLERDRSLAATFKR